MDIVGACVVVVCLVVVLIVVTFVVDTVVVVFVDFDVGDGPSVGIAVVVSGFENAPTRKIFKCRM